MRQQGAKREEEFSGGGWKGLAKAIRRRFRRLPVYNRKVGKGEDL